MSTDAPFTPPRKKLNIFWWIGGIFLVLLLLFLVQLFGPSPRIIVSPQTTYITKPLSPKGLPDYEQYALERSRKGVTPENNAAALLWRALWPGDLEPKYYAAMADELGLEEIPLEDDALVRLYSKSNQDRIGRWLSKRVDPEVGNEAVEEFELESTADPEPVIDQTTNRPWTSAHLPPLAEWLAENEKPLDLIVEASTRPRYYSPSPTFLNSEHELLIQMLLLGVQSAREAARSLSARAMWHVGEGRPLDAWQDLLAVHRLARLVGQGQTTLVEQLVALAISNIACDGTLALLHDGNLKAGQARQVQRDLAALPDLIGIANSIDKGERLSALDAFVRIGSGGGGKVFSQISDGGDDFGNSAFNIISVDWNLVLRETNHWYDRLAAAARSPNRIARQQALAQINADMMQLVAEQRTPRRLLAGVVSRHARSELVSGMMLGLFLPAVQAATAAEDRGNATLELTRLAAALAVYRAEQGTYPETLDALVPDVIDKLPVDLYNAKPFIYKRDGEGYLLYSAGENGTDDGGSNEQMEILKGGQSLHELDAAEREKLLPQIPAGADDISIRLPRPAFELPKVEH